MAACLTSYGMTLLLVLGMTLHAAAGHQADYATSADAGVAIDHTADVSSEFVTMLTADTFDAYVQQHVQVMVHFCWEQGSNCKKHLADVEQLARSLGTLRTVQFARVCSTGTHAPRAGRIL